MTDHHVDLHLCLRDMNQVGVSLRPVNDVLIYRRIDISIKLAGAHFYLVSQSLCNSVFPKETSLTIARFKTCPVRSESKAITIRPPSHNSQIALRIV